MWFFSYLFGVLFGDQKSQAVSALLSGSEVNSWPGDVRTLDATWVPERVATIGSADILLLTTSQIEALTTVQAAALSTSAIPGLSVSQVAAFETRDLAVMTSAQYQAFTSADIAALTTGQIQVISTSAIAALSSNQVRAIETQDLVSMTTAQIRALTDVDLANVTTDQVQALADTGYAGLTTAQQALLPAIPFHISPITTTNQISTLSIGQVAGINTTEIVALTTIQVVALTTTALTWLSSEQVSAFETQDLVVLTTAQIDAFTSTQTAAFTSIQVMAFTTAQIAAFGNGPEYQNLTNASPIILDLDGDGIKTLDIRAGVQFDLFADGKPTSTGWVSSGDGLLVLDRNHDGVINNGSELFGTSTKLSSGEDAPDGYAALRELDSNHDGLISSDDGKFADLRVWVDVNSDGVSTEDEIKTLAALGIAKINLSAEIGTTTDNGNLLGLTSTYETQDGVTHAAADVWFVADKRLGDATTVAAQSKLRTQVSGLAQAISTFSDSADGVGSYTITGNSANEYLASANVAPVLASGSMAEVLKQFDSNGNLTQQSSTLTSSSPSSLALSSLQAPTSQGILVAPPK